MLYKRTCENVNFIHVLSMWVGVGCFCLNYCINSGWHEGKHACGIMEAQVALIAAFSSSAFWFIVLSYLCRWQNCCHKCASLIVALLFCLSSSLYSSAVCLFLSPILHPFPTGHRTTLQATWVKIAFNWFSSNRLVVGTADLAQPANLHGDVGRHEHQHHQWDPSVMASPDTHQWGWHPWGGGHAA